VEHDFSPAHQLQLGQGARMVAWLTDLQPVQCGNLVGTDHQRAGMQSRDGLRLRARQAQGGGLRRLIVERCLVDLGGDRLEGQAEPLQQFAAVGGARCQDQARGSGGRFHGAV